MKNKMMKNVKRFILSSFILILNHYITVSASEPIQIGLDRYVAEGGMLKLYINHNQGDDFSIQPENVKVVFGNNQMNTQNIMRFSETSVPVSYKCVVDVSGSMSQERIDQAKEVIKDLANKKGPEDSIAITALGNELIQSEYMTDPSQIAEKADVLTLTHEDTNLYYAIVQEIKGLQTEDEVGRKRCLIIFSDGADDQATGITREEAESSVKDSHIPIFTVGLLKSKDNENAKEMAKVLGSFARISSGGVHFAPALGDGSVKTIADSVIGVLNSSFALEESLEDVNVSGKEVVLKVSVTTVDGSTAEDSITVPESDIKIIQEEQKKVEVQEEPVVQELVVEEPVVEEPAEEEPVVEEKTILGIPQNVFFIGIGVLVLLIILTVVMLIKKNKDEEEAQEEEVPTEEDEHNSVTAPVEMNRTIGKIQREGITFAPDMLAGKTMPVSFGKRYAVTLITIGKSNEKKYEIALQDTYTIGRSGSRCDLVMPNDNALSGLHCTLLAQDGSIYIRDENSTNGTFVNGVPVLGKFKLNQDDTILLGSYEYRIYWE